MNPETEKTDIFSNCSLFHPLDSAEREALYALFEWIVLNDGQAIIKEGEHADFLLVVSKGALEVSRASGSEHQLIGFARAGSVLGEMGILSDEVRFATCRAVNTTCVGMLSKENFSRLRTANPKLFAQLIMQLTSSLCRRLRQTTELVGSLKQRNQIAVKAASQILEAAMTS